jgi:cytochrome b561
MAQLTVFDAAPYGPILVGRGGIRHGLRRFSRRPSEAAQRRAGPSTPERAHWPWRRHFPDFVVTAGDNVMHRSAIARTAAERPSSRSEVSSYDPVMKAVHWLTLLLVIGAFACIWAERQADTKNEAEIFIHLHQSLGFTILGLTIFRLCWRQRAEIPRLPVSLPAIQKLAARATEYLLYGLLSVQPVLGILYTNASRHLVNLYFLGDLPVVLGPDRMLAERLIALHDLVAVLLLIFIGLHAAAALFHHFVRRDDVLNAMLPRWLQRPR